MWHFTWRIKMEKKRSGIETSVEEMTVQKAEHCTYHKHLWHSLWLALDGDPVQPLLESTFCFFLLLLPEPAISNQNGCYIFKVYRSSNEQFCGGKNITFWTLPQQCYWLFCLWLIIIFRFTFILLIMIIYLKPYNIFKLLQKEDPLAWWWLHMQAWAAFMYRKFLYKCTKHVQKRCG